jgi:hypothetical protein
MTMEVLASERAARAAWSGAAAATELPPQVALSFEPDHREDIFAPDGSPLTQLPAGGVVNLLFDPERFEKPVQGAVWAHVRPAGGEVSDYLMIPGKDQTYRSEVSIPEEAHGVRMWFSDEADAKVLQWESAGGRDYHFGVATAEARQLQTILDQGEVQVDRGPPGRYIFTLPDGSWWMFRATESMHNDDVADRYGLPRSTRSRREVALYEISRCLNLNAVPRTYFVELNGESGTVQRSTEVPPELVGAKDAELREMELQSLQAVLVVQYIAGIQDSWCNRYPSRMNGYTYWQTGDGETGCRDFLRLPSAADGRADLAREARELIQGGRGELVPDLRDGLLSAKPGELEDVLLALGARSEEIDWVLERLKNVLTRGLQALVDAEP